MQAKCDNVQFIMQQILQHLVDLHPMLAKGLLFFRVPRQRIYNRHFSVNDVGNKEDPMGATVTVICSSQTQWHKYVFVRAH